MGLGNPMACAVGVAALEVLQEENLAQNVREEPIQTAKKLKILCV